MNRPIIPWNIDRPPANEKVQALTRYGVLLLGSVTAHDWDSGTIVCWAPCPKRPANWDELLSTALQRTVENC